MTSSNQTPALPLRRVLLTGFGPFPGVTDNASARLVLALAPPARSRFCNCQIEYEILATEWDAAPRRLRELLTAHDPDVILSFGVARDATGFRLETRGMNACRTDEDAAGRPPLDSVLRVDGPNAHVCSAPLDLIAERLKARALPVSISDDAGGYLCNAVYFHALDYASSTPAPKLVAFVHIPADLSGAKFTIETAVEGALEILDVCIGGVSVNA